MNWILLVFAACLVLVFAIGYLTGFDRGERKCEARWEDEWEARKGWLVPSAPLPDHGYAPPVHRRATDAFTHASGDYQALPPVLGTVSEPIRTEVLVGYRGRHSTDQPTGPIPREIPKPPGEITDLITRILDEADRAVAP